jgi:hypothetical protein
MPRPFAIPPAAITEFLFALFYHQMEKLVVHLFRYDHTASKPSASVNTSICAFNYRN